MAKKYQKYWISSDFHFGHDKLIEYSDRPEDFSEQIIKNHSKIIEPDDIFIFLGDFCIGEDDMWHNKFMSRIPVKTKKWFIKGNHDKKTLSWYYDHGWNVVLQSMCINIYGKIILFTHKPVELPSIFSIDFNIHGHLHNTEHHGQEEIRNSSKHTLIMMEHSYAPQLLQSLMTK